MSSAILLEPGEFEMLEGRRPELFKLYFMIKKHMDFATGIVGLKRGISHQSLKEEMWLEAEKGVKTKQFSKHAIIRMQQRLEAFGLLQRISTEDKLIFKLPLARTDKSAPKKAASRPLGYPDIPENEKNFIDSVFVERCDKKSASATNPKAATPPRSYFLNNIISTKQETKKAKNFYNGKKEEKPHDRITSQYAKQIEAYERKSGRSVWPPS